MVKKLFKSRLFFFILGISLTSIIGVGAASLIYSKDVTYDNTLSGLKSTTVQGALDELYEKAKNAPSCNSEGECTVTCPSGKVFLSTDNGYKCVSGVTFGGKKVIPVTSGDGLYKDSVTEGRYYYRGTNPNNYITFNNETWRILSIESNGTLKIIRNTTLSMTYFFDVSASCDEIAYSNSKKNFNKKDNTYTYEIENKIYLVPETFNSGCNKWDKPATFNEYLNGTYYNSLLDESKKKIVSGTFNIASPGDASKNSTLNDEVKNEKQKQWNGKIAIISATELLRASTNKECINLNSGYNNKTSSPCKESNWLWVKYGGWTLSPSNSNDVDVWQLDSNANCIWLYTATSGGGPTNSAKPVLHLSKDITLKGTGTSSDPYQLSV